MKQTTSLPKYSELSKALEKTEYQLHPSQVHGLICGLLCGNTDDNAAWQKLLATGEPTPKLRTHLQDLYDASAKQLSDFLFELQLLLPADKTPMNERAEALSVWCQGFLTGLKLAQVPIEGREDNEMTEAINDIIEIAQMNFEDVKDDEQDEAAFVELVEYIRMATILIYQDLHPSNNLH